MMLRGERETAISVNEETGKVYIHKPENVQIQLDKEWISLKELIGKIGHVRLAK